MESRAKLFGHPIHQMLIVFPLGLLAMAVIFDVLSVVTDNTRWTDMAFYMIGAGILTSLVAAVFGLIDYLAIPSGTRAKRVGALHGGGNVIVVLLFAGSWMLRWPDPLNPGTLAYLLSYAGAGLSLLTGWLGGELVDRLGVGVDEGANLDAPSSLSSRHSWRADAPGVEGSLPDGPQLVGPGGERTRIVLCLVRPSIAFGE
jgi:uncharacterized membrane protein